MTTIVPQPGDSSGEVLAPRWFACCEDCGASITGDTSEAIRAAIVLHKMEGCDD